MKFPTLSLMLSFLSMCGSGSPVSESTIPKPEGRRIEWGCYQILWNPTQFENGLDSQISSLGGTPQYVLFFRDLNRTRGFPTQIVEICRKYGLTPVVSFEPAPWRQTESYPGLEEIVRSDWDDYFIDYAQEAARCSSEIIFRFGFEMNGDWFSWGHKPELFVAAWQRIHRIFAANKASNVRWMYCPNVIWGKQERLNSVLTYYPGDEYVDVVGLDGYNFGDDYDRYHSWTSYSEIFEESLRILSQKPKPLLIGEIGVAPDPVRKPEWLRNFLIEVSRDSRVSGFIYYNYYPKRRGYPNWRLDSDSLSLRVFRSWVDRNEQTDTPLRPVRQNDKN